MTYPIDTEILSLMQPGVGYRRRRIRFLLGSGYTSKNVERATRRMCKAGVLTEYDGAYFRAAVA